MSVLTKAADATRKILQPKRAGEPTPTPAVKPAWQKNAPPKWAEGLTELVVWSVPAVNTRLLICHEPGADGGNPMNLVNVTVRDNSLFLKKMALRARRVTDRKFNLEGPLPRRRGHW